MSKLSTLVGKSKTYTIGNIELELKPRTLGDLDLVMLLQSNDEVKKTNAMKELIKRTLKDAVSDATDEEINSIAFEYFKDIADAVVDVNGLSNGNNTSTN